jgi:hypothetical protein
VEGLCAYVLEDEEIAGVDALLGNSGSATHHHKEDDREHGE